MIQANQFHKGIDCDTHIKYVQNGHMVDAMNIWLMSKGDHHAACNQESTTYCFNIGTGTYNAIQAYGYKGGESISGAVIFGSEGSIYFFNPKDKDLCLIATGFDFQGDIECITPQAYNDGLCSTVYWTDGTDLRSLEINCDAPQDISKTYLRPEDPIDCIEFKKVVNGGSNKGGTYQFAYRYYSKTDCRYSNWSSFTCLIPLIPKDGCVQKRVAGARIDQSVGRSIVLGIDENKGGACYDSIQVLVIKNNDGSKENQTVGYITEPSESFYKTREYTYDGTAREVSIDLSDILIEDIALVGAGGLLQYKDRLIYANPVLNKLEADNGSPMVVDAEILKKPLGEKKALEEGTLTYTFKETTVGLPDGTVVGFEFEVEDNDWDWHNLEVQSAGNNDTEVSAIYEGDRFTHYSSRHGGPWSFKAFAVKDGCLFYGDGTSDNGTVEITLIPQDAYRPPYQCEEDYKCIGHFRGEVYAYGAKYTDKYGNSIVCPIDLSGIEDQIVGTTQVSFIGSEEILGEEFYFIESSEVLSQGSFITINGNEYTVLGYLDGKGYAVLGVYNASDTGEATIIKKSSGNSGSSWAWKYPERKDCPLFDDDGYINAIGLKLKGLTNHPSWAVKVEIVRRKRIENILYQTPHIPTIGVEGVSTSYIYQQEGEFENCPDYEKQYDHVAPKVFRLGHAANLVQCEAPVSTDDLQSVSFYYGILVRQGVEFTKGYWTPSWARQCDDTGKREVSNGMFIAPPELIYNIDGESFDLKEMKGAQVRIVDAVAWRARKIQELVKWVRGLINEDSNEDFDLDNVVPIVSKAVTIFSACNESNYFYSPNQRYYNGSYCLEEIIRACDQQLLFDNECVGIKDCLLQPLSTTGQEISGMFNGNELGHIDKYGWLNELGLQQFEHPSIRGDYKDCFAPASKNQRGYIITLGEKILDFTKAMYQCNLFQNINSPYSIPRLVEETYLNKDFLPKSDKNVFSGDDFIRQNEIHGGSYILNIEKGLGDDRYGSIDQQFSDWISTGACTSILDPNESLDFEVWGGDCFITKSHIKVNESTPRPVCYYPFSELLGFKDNEGGYSGFSRDFSEVSNESIPCKTGSYQRNVEVLELYLESRVNTNYMGNDSIYPYNPNVSGIDTDWDNYYNPNYSAENCLKVSSSKEEVCKTADGKLTIGWSDERVRGTIPTPFTDTVGYDRFRVNNNLLLNGQYGPIQRIDTLEDNAIYVFQKDRIFYQPVGVDLVRDADGAGIALGTTGFLGSNGFYNIGDVGICYPNHVVKGDGAFYGIDVKRKKFYGFSSRFGDFKFLSDSANFDKCLCDLLEGCIEKGEVNLHYDRAEERVFISRRGHGTLVYNVRMGYLETKMDKDIDFGFSVDDRLFWVNEGRLYEAYGDDGYSQIFDCPQESYVEYMVNGEYANQQIFESIEILGDKGIKEIEAWTHNENQKDCLQHTGKVPVKYSRQHHTYYNNLLRDKKSKKRLRGECMRVRIYFENNSKACIFSAKAYTRRIP